MFSRVFFQSSNGLAGTDDAVRFFKGVSQSSDGLGSTDVVGIFKGAVFNLLPLVV